MANRVYPIVWDPTLGQQRTFDINNDVLVISLDPQEDDTAISLGYANNYFGKVLLTDTDVNFSYLYDKFDHSIFDIVSDTITILQDSIDEDVIAYDVDVSDKGFNADMVDGHHASEFANLYDDQVFSGRITFNEFILFNSGLRIQGNEYYNYAEHVYFTTEKLNLDYSQSADFPAFPGIRIIREQFTDFVEFVYSSDIERFRVQNQDNELLRIQGATPIYDDDYATKAYVDQVIQLQGTDNLPYYKSIHSKAFQINHDDTVIELFSIPAGTVITSIYIKVLSSYNNGVYIVIGTYNEPDLVMQYDSIDLTVEDTTLVYPMSIFNTQQNIYLRFVGSPPSTGELVVVFNFAEMINP